MNRGKDFLSVKDLMILMGTDCYNSAWKRHKAIREAIRPGMRSLLISDYCEFEGICKNQTHKILGRNRITM